MSGTIIFTIEDRKYTACFIPFYNGLPTVPIVYIYIYIYIYIYLYIFIYTHIYVYTYICSVFIGICQRLGYVKEALKVSDEYFTQIRADILALL